VRRAHRDGKVGAKIFSNQNEGGGGNVARADQILDRGFGIFAQALLAGMDKATLAVSAIVEGKDVESCPVQSQQIVDCVAQVAVGSVKINRGVAALRGARDPPTSKLRSSRCVACEAD